jgi:hypothetical protein
MVKVNITQSDSKDKKLMAVFTFDDGKTKTTHFGASGYMDYILYNKRDGRVLANDKKRNYLARHKVNEDWDDYTSAGSLSRWILWNKPTLKASINDYKKRFNLN